MLSDHTAQGLLNHITGTAPIFAEPSAYLALFTTAPTSDSGSGATEVSTSGTAYARVLTTGSWATSSGSGPSTIQTNAQITFATATGAGWGTIVAWGLYDAITSGNLLYWDWLGSYAWQPVTINSANPTIFTIGTTAYAAALTVVLDTSLRFGGTAPTYSAGTPSNNTVLTVLSPSGLTFELQNGATTIATSAAGLCSVRQVLAQSIPSGVTPIFPSGGFVLGAA
jgi:hypothetical protein